MPEIEGIGAKEKARRSLRGATPGMALGAVSSGRFRL